MIMLLNHANSTLSQQPAWHHNVWGTEAQVYGSNFQHWEGQEHVDESCHSPQLAQPYPAFLLGGSEECLELKKLIIEKDIWRHVLRKSISFDLGS